MDANRWGPADPKGKPYMELNGPYMEENEPDIEANEPDMETNEHDLGKTDDWRAQLSPISRQRIVNKIMDTLKRHLPLSGQEGLQELQKIAQRFEEKIYSAATNQSYYLQKISLKMLTMETKSQNSLPNSLLSNADPNGKPYMELNGPDMEENEPDIEANEPYLGKTDDWRAQLSLISRQRIVNKITDTLKRHLPLSGQEGLQELQKIAQRFEEKIYSAATNQSDYLQKISLKMLTMETKSQNSLPNSLPSNAVGNCNETPDPGAALDSTAQAGHVNGGDWQEEVYQKE